ncbi:sigma-54-dependent Fis family transcriptional regulator [Variovorax sp. WS11]|uniref:sigma-54-dependent Fis family transcriptional regulator n=1 Tax=Variovorax sp. WS11 TaxID=1105204 RepID=UPI000D0DC2CC|nr:sigma-54-dependent Fis family transcriptional regulator [Variovorax sp. WS11]NDZ12756.1 sigma-54-dependent Fis family transcriptional regulator [Variovorax sp. WS11]PSL84693.1 sigma-54-dependent Fis family transcriptional regulator [Variovorax sp. WS11]
MAGTGSVVLFANAEGVILCRKGDADFMTGPHGRFFVPGASWVEKTAGTNAVGTCIATRTSVTVDTGEHYLHQFRTLCGAAAPIYNSSGHLAGVLAAYGTTPAAHSHTPGFIRTVAVMIENRRLVHEMSSEIVIHFHSVAEYIGTIKQGIAVFDRDGKLLGSNSAARTILRIDAEKLADTRFNDVFDNALPLPRIVDKAQALGSGVFPILLADGREVSLVVSVGARSHPTSALTNTPGKAAAEPGQARPGRSGVNVLLKDLDLGDPLMRRAISKASMILGSDIPLVIEGESGVGKEVFTAAFHNSGPRQHGPFVAVNCAAIPEGLIESELFGYEEGAFTGAKKKGYQGRLIQANGGTLFLDEIGDMPLALQGRLLRVLQERQATPLGSARSVPLDLSLVCATHRTLRAEVEAGRFREDLYYRLNGLRVQLPALRQRQDVAQLINLMISAESGGRRIELDPEVWQALLKHPWPGNIRQLQMVLRISLAILGSETQLTLQHLPDEFMQLEEPDRDSSPATHGPTDGNLASIELEAIRKAVTASDGNLSKAARALGISRKTLYRKLGKLPASPGGKAH